METQPPPHGPPPQYAEYKPLDEGQVLVRRTRDGEVLLAQAIDGMGEPFRRGGAAWAAAAVLNHENLVSLHPFQWIQSQATGDGNESRPRPSYAVWDWCDAGTLADLLADLPSAGSPAAGFLPESLVWHVGLGMLRALRWLHEGVREAPCEYDCEGGGGGDIFEPATLLPPEDDWMPVLHRAVRAENIFLQHPRGIETYGFAKLGNFARCFVSGKASCNGAATPVVTSREDILPIHEIKRGYRDERRGRVIEEEWKRPYTPRHELADLGAILYRMMTNQALPPLATCERRRRAHVPLPGDEDDKEYQQQCPHPDSHPDSSTVPNTVPNANTNTDTRTPQRLRKRHYTPGLRRLVRNLLDMVSNNDDGNNGDSNGGDDSDANGSGAAGAALAACWPDYVAWRRDTADGRLFRDARDDARLRARNAARAARARG